MTPARKLLLETLTGHFALLKNSHPLKASMPLARRARQAVRCQLRSGVTRLAHAA